MNRRRIVPVIALLAASAPVAAAQMKSALPAKQVSQVRVVTPVTLTQGFIGDSARFYKLKYDRYEQRRDAFAGTGAVAIGLGVAAMVRHPCHKPTCTFRPPAFVNKPLVIGGITLVLTSEVFKFMAAKAMTRALWWQNAGQAR